MSIKSCEKKISQELDVNKKIDYIFQYPETRFMLNYIKCRECESFTERPEQQDM